MFGQVLLYIITFGIYSIYWFHVTFNELNTANGKEASGCLWTILLFVPIANFSQCGNILRSTLNSSTISIRELLYSFFGWCSHRWSGSWCSRT